MSLFQKVMAEKLVRTIIPLHLGYKFFIFQLTDQGQDVTVSLSHKGWMCDYIEPQDNYIKRCKRYNHRSKPTRWSCSFNKDKLDDGQICRHVRAVNIWMQRMKIIKCREDGS